jgi:hypothetical protein
MDAHVASTSGRIAATLRDAAPRLLARRAPRRAPAAAVFSAAAAAGGGQSAAAAAAAGGEPVAAPRAPAPAPPPPAETAPWSLRPGSARDVGRASKKNYAEVAYLSGRTRVVARHFPGALGVDDFLHRLEIALYAYGFHGDNAIAMVNLCRDEITAPLKSKIDAVFGSSFNTNGLGGVLTCGVTGVSAGLSHAPVSQGSGRERYVFFSFPHISIDARGEVGTISRPGRQKVSCACGALHAALGDIRAEGVAANCRMPGVHDPLDPEYTILKQRIARRLRYEGAGDEDVNAMSLVDITKVAERTCTDDLEFLIARTVDTSRAYYAVVTGVQVHNWATHYDDESPNLEFVWPTSVYVVINGARTHIDLAAMPSLTPRQTRALAADGRGGGGGAAGRAAADEPVCNSTGASTVREVESPVMHTSREGREAARRRAQLYAELTVAEGLEPERACAWPSWQSGLASRHAAAPHRRDGGDNSAEYDHATSSDDESEDQAALRELLRRMHDEHSRRPRAPRAGGGAGSSFNQPAGGAE